MGKHHHKQIQPLTGYFIGWGDDLMPHRYFKLATDSGDRLVKVAKSLRPLIQDWEPGMWLTLLTQQRVNPNTGETTIKVKQLLMAPRMDAPNSLGYRLSVAEIEKSAEKATPNPPTQIRVCQGSSCRRRGSEGICQAMESYFDRHDLADRVEIKHVKCLHQCKAAPHAIITRSTEKMPPEKTHYRQLQHYQVKAILMQHFPIDSPATPIRYNLVRNIGNYLQQQIGSTSTAL